MSGAADRVRLTYDDLLALPDDGMRHELIDGEHFVTPSPSWRHQRIIVNLLRLIDSHVHANRLGVTFGAPLDVVFTPHDVVEPDVLFFTSRGFKAHMGERIAEGPPDLAVEVLSPSTRRRDEHLKRQLYERMGVGEYWIVDPESETIHVFRLREEHYERAELSVANADVLTSSLFPGLELALSAVFEMP
jgi:Uma2 family endonuclease